MSSCATVSKYLLCALNVLLWVAGGVWLGFGVYISAYAFADFIIMVSGINFYYIGCYIMIAIGSVMLVVGYLGCWAAIIQNRWALVIYFVFLLILFILHLGVGIWGFAQRESIEQDIYNTMNDSVPITYTGNETDVLNLIAIQSVFQCCGATRGCQDWLSSTPLGCDCDEEEDLVCGTDPDDVCINSVTSEFIYLNSCYDVIRNVILDNMALVAGVAMGVAVLQILGMALTIIICRNVKRIDYERY